MDIRIEKLWLIDEILHTDDAGVLARLKKLLQSIKKEEDIALTAEQEAILMHDIEAAEDDIKHGRVYTMEQVKAHFDDLAKKPKS